MVTWPRAARRWWRCTRSPSGRNPFSAHIARVRTDDSIVPQAHGCRQPIIAKRSFPEIQSIATTTPRINKTIKATWSKLIVCSLARREVAGETSLFTATSGLISQLINVHAAARRSGVLPLAWISETPPIRAMLRARALTKMRLCRAIAYRRVEKGVVIRSLTQARGGVVNGEDERGRP